MVQCASCGAEIPTDSQFCNACGTKQESAGSPATGGVGSTTTEAKLVISRTPTPKPAGPSRWPLVVGVIAAVLVILVAGFAAVSSYQKAEAAKQAQAAAAARKLEEAKAAASKVLGKVEECQSAVTVGVLLDDLSKKAASAREAALEFSRSDNAAMLPEFSQAVNLAAQDYIDSCRAWFEDNKKAQAKWQKAYDKWDPLSGTPAPKLEDYQNDSKYQAMWSKADQDLATANSALSPAAR
jgi:type II secretory pathway pseudopilin PulG